MKRTNRWIGCLLAFVMAFTFALPAVHAAGTLHFTEVFIHKIMMDKETFDGFESKTYDHTKAIEDVVDFFGENSREVSGIRFDFYKEGDYTEDMKPKTNAQRTYTYITGETVNFMVAPGTYLIVENREESEYEPPAGSFLAGMKAVPQELTFPFVNEEGEFLNTVHLYPKNTEEKPDLVKRITDEFAENVKPNYNIGDTVPYEVRTTVPANSKYAAFVWEDTMDPGLTLKKDLTITAENGVTFEEETDYTIVYKNDGGFRLALTETGLQKINGRSEDLVITLTYTATLNENAIVEVNKAEKNTIKLTYGNDPGVLYEVESDGPEVYTGGQFFLKLDNKQDHDGNPIFLQGAEFVIYRKADGNREEFLKRINTPGEASEWKWVWEEAEEQEVPEDAFVLVSDSEGKFEVKGLEYGDYFLKETKAPDGYAKQVEDAEFEIRQGSYGMNNPKLIFNLKVTIPQTGGMGTVAFGVVGVVLMGGALLGMKRKKEQEEQ